MTSLLAVAHATVTATPDPSWILSTCAAAAATLLAIVGGFLVAQLIALASEQHAADTRLTDARDAWDVAQDNLATAAEALRAAATQALLSDRELAMLLAVRGTAAPSEVDRCAAATPLLAELPAGDREHSISQAVSISADIRKRAINALISIVPVAESPDSWEKFKWEHFRLPVNEEAQWRAVYSLIAAQRAIEAAEANRSAGKRRSVSGEIEYRFQDPSADPVSGSVNGFREAHEQGTREVLAVWRQAVKDAQVTSAAANAAVLRRKELIPLVEFGFGVGVLAYLAFAVLLPLIVLATGPRSFSFVSRYIVPASLGVGVSLLIAFFAYLSGKTRQQAVSLHSTGDTDPGSTVPVPAVHANS